ncbi:MAG: serine hydrolase domain-containing protein [Phototrophicaceae bacterium]
MNTTTPENVGMSSERLARIDTVMSDFVKDNQLPGIMTLVQRRGEIVQFGQYGMMDIAAQRPIEEDAIFRIYSMTKPLTSIALMQLHDEGKVNLNDPIAKYIPAFANTKVYTGMTSLGMQLVDQNPAITVRHLLTHTAGLSYGFFYDHPIEELYRQVGQQRINRENSLSDLIEKIAAIPLISQAGTAWRYSMATDVIGYLVQILADMPLADALSERIFKPLGMMDTGFQVAPENIERLAQIYHSEGLYNPIAFQAHEVYGVGDVTQATQQPSGGGGLTSTLADYLRFANCLLNGGELDGFRLIAPRTLQWMTSDHLDAHMLPIKIGLSPVGARFGLGFRVVKEIGESYTHCSTGEYGWSGAAQTYFCVAPAEDMILMFMSQLLPAAPYPVRTHFVNLAYQAITD